MNGRPVGFGLAPRPGRNPGAGEQQRFQRGIGQHRRQRPAEPRGAGAAQVIAHCTARQARAAGDHPVSRTAPMLQS